MQADATLAIVGLRTRTQASPTKIARGAIAVGCLFALCVITLGHDVANLSTGNENSVEAGRGMEDIAKFHKNVNAAPLSRKLGFLGLLSLAAYCLATSPRNTKLRNPSVLFAILACLGWLAASFFWSVDWRHTARESVRIAAYAFVALSFALRFRPRQLCTVIVLGLLGSVLAACSASLLTGGFRPWESDFRLHGTLHSNLLSHHAMAVLLVAVALLPGARRVWFWRTLILAMLSVILLTKTRGALASSILGVTFIQLIGRPVWKIAFLGSMFATFGLTILLLVTVAGSQTQSQIQEMLTLGRSEGVGTLTGRIPLWEAVWEESQGRRWQGYGYGAFWSIERTEDMFEKLKWYPRHAHSAYVHTILDLGYMGIALLIVLVATCILAALLNFRRTNDRAYVFYAAFLATGFMDGLVEICYVSPRELGLFVSIVIMGLIIAHPTMDSDGGLDSKTE